MNTGWVVIDLCLTDKGYDMVATTPNREGGYIEVGVLLSHNQVRDSGGGLWALIFMAQEALCCEAIHNDEE